MDYSEKRKLLIDWTKKQLTGGSFKMEIRHQAHLLAAPMGNAV